MFIDLGECLRLEKKKTKKTGSKTQGKTAKSKLINV
jgi:hypothetical protein